MTIDAISTTLSFEACVLNETESFITSTTGITMNFNDTKIHAGTVLAATIPSNSTNATFSWVLNGKVVSKAATYKVPASADQGFLSIKTTYVDSSGVTHSSIDRQLITINATPTGSVGIAGDLTLGRTVVADTSTIGDADGVGALSYQWYNGTAAIAGATSKSYTITTETKLSVKASYTDSAGFAEKLVSKSLDVRPNILGTAGADKLTGTSFADNFIFGVVNNNAKLKDVVTNFKHAQHDLINLAAIDADLTTAGDQAFSLVSAFGNNATGQMVFDAKTHTLLISTDADNAAEYSIVLTGVNSVDASDFVL